MSRGKRAVVRPSPCLFEGPLEFVSFQPEKGTTRYGHLVSSDTSAGTSVILPEMSATSVIVATDAVKVLTSADTLPAIPASVFCGDAATKRQHAGSSIDFISFCIPAGAPSILFVRPCTTAATTEWTPDVLLNTITRVVGPAFGTPTAVASANMDGWLPCSHFTDGTDATSVPIALLTLTPLGVEQSTRPAHALAAAGLLVSAPFSVHGSSGPAQFARVTSSVLKWIKDSDVMTDLSAIVDQLPGLLHGNNKRESAFGNNAAASLSPDTEPSTMSGVIYDAGFNVQRLMICWGMLAASLSRTMDDISDVPEPLCSYIRLIRGFERMRDSHGSDAVDAADLTKLLTYNVAPKLTAAQAGNALTLFYWAAVHEDDATRELPKDVARRALEMYVPFGHVILRKRAYRFNS